jgi:hypothetical protein
MPPSGPAFPPQSAIGELLQPPKKVSTRLLARHLLLGLFLLNIALLLGWWMLDLQLGRELMDSALALLLQ